MIGRAVVVLFSGVVLGLALLSCIARSEELTPTCGHRDAPIGTVLRVTVVQADGTDGRSIRCVVVDRGLGKSAAVLDLSARAALGLGMSVAGRRKIRVDVLP